MRAPSAVCTAKEIVTGQVEVKQTFKISKVGTIAGGLVTEGKVHAKDKMSLPYRR